MKKVKVKRDELLEIVKENEENHINELEEAKEGYRVTVRDTLRKLLGQANRHIKNQAEAPADLNKIHHLHEPQDCRKEYSKVRKMLEMSVDEEIELDANEFAQYVEDDWLWARSAKHANASYTRAVRV